MKILILGGSGVISGAIARDARHRNWNVHIYTRGKRDVPAPGCIAHTGDRSDASRISEVLRGHGPFDAVFDMICYEPSDAEKLADVLGAHTRHLIFCSTVDVYARTGENYPTAEDAPQDSPSEYGRKKARIEALYTERAAAGGYALSIGRPAFTYGPGGGVVATFGWDGSIARRIDAGKPILVQGDGTQLWTCTHAADVARGFLAMVGNPTARGKAYNLCNREVISWNAYYRQMAEAIGAPVPDLVHVPSDVLLAWFGPRADVIRVNFQHSNVSDTRRAIADLGFHTQHNFRDSMREILPVLIAGEQWSPIPDADYDAFVALWRKSITTLLTLK